MRCKKNNGKNRKKNNSFADQSEKKERDIQLILINFLHTPQSIAILWRDFEVEYA
jgi:hypothetical protein